MLCFVNHGAPNRLWIRELRPALLVPAPKWCSASTSCQLRVDKVVRTSTTSGVFLARYLFSLHHIAALPQQTAPPDASPRMPSRRSRLHSCRDGRGCIARDSSMGDPDQQASELHFPPSFTARISEGGERWGMRYSVRREPVPPTGGAGYSPCPSNSVSRAFDLSLAATVLRWSRDGPRCGLVGSTNRCPSRTF